MNERLRRDGRRLTTPLGLLLAVLLAVAACGSVNTGTGTVAGTAVVAGETSVANPPAASPAAPVATANGTIPPSVDALQATMVSVIKQVTPSVVQIETSQGLGSGVVYDSAGHIVTNAHVVGSSTTFKVTLSDGKVYDGSLVGTYPADDIAVIKVSAGNLTPASFADSSKLNVGDFVLAVGNPLGLQSSVAEGIVSALSRAVPEPNGNTLPDVIQTSAAINPGNSGGALVDLTGQVIGIPTLAAADPQVGGSAPGIGFAIASNRATLVANQLISNGKVTASGRAYLGVTIEDTQAGPAVISTVPKGPAATAGIIANDLIMSIDGQQTPDTATIGAVLAKLQPGNLVQVQVQHQNGANATVSVTLGQLPG